MSFWKQFFICCDSTASHSDLLLNETKKKHSLKNQSTNHSHSPSKSPHLSHRITIRSIKKEDKNSKLNDTSSIKRFDDYSDLYSINLLTQTQSIITSPEYIPLNNIEISSSKMETFEALATADVAKFLYMNLKYYDGLETAFINIDLKLSDLQDEMQKRDNIIEDIKNSYVSASNDNIPYIWTV